MTMVYNIYTHTHKSHFLLLKTDRKKKKGIAKLCVDHQITV